MCDPVVHYTLNGKRLALNLSHQIPFTRKEIPTYSENLSRVTSFIRDHVGPLCMVDIGANIGDSYALAGSKPGDHFLLVEGSAHYLRLLTLNTQDDPAVTRVQALLTNTSGSGKGGLILTNGTARVGEEAADTVEYQTLDDLLTHLPGFTGANLLKSDVDGYDSRVLAGAERLITTSSPVLFFEHHPFLLTVAGDDDRYIFPLLKKWGYSRLIVYDLKGFLLGLVDSDDADLLGDLMFYAKSTGDFYFDVCAFHDRFADTRNKFIESEKQYYSDLIDDRLRGTLQ